MCMYSTIKHLNIDILNCLIAPSIHRVPEMNSNNVVSYKTWDKLLLVVMKDERSIEFKSDNLLAIFED